MIDSSIYYYHDVIHFDPDFYKIKGRGGTYSMILSKSGIRKLYEKMISSELWSPVDMQIHTTVPNLHEYSLKSPLATHWFQERDSDTVVAPEKLQE